MNTNTEENYEEFSNLQDQQVHISDINAVSTFEFTDIEYPICCVNKNRCRIINKCSHKFCDECITSWLSTSKKCHLYD